MSRPLRIEYSLTELSTMLNLSLGGYSSCRRSTGVRARLKTTWAFAGEYSGWIIMVRKRSPDLVGSRDDERHKRPEERQPLGTGIHALYVFNFRLKELKIKLDNVKC